MGPEVLPAILASPFLLNLVVAWTKDIAKALLRRKLTRAEVRVAKGVAAVTLAAGTQLLLRGAPPDRLIAGVAMAALAYFGGGGLHDAANIVGHARYMTRIRKGLP